MIEKDGTHAICLRCSDRAEPESNPPLCRACAALEKKAAELQPDLPGLREFGVDPKEVFDGFSLS